MGTRQDARGSLRILGRSTFLACLDKAPWGRCMHASDLVIRHRIQEPGEVAGRRGAATPAGTVRQSEFANSLPNGSRDTWTRGTLGRARIDMDQPAQPSRMRAAEPGASVLNRARCLQSGQVSLRQLGGKGDRGSLACQRLLAVPSCSLQSSAVRRPGTMA